MLNKFYALTGISEAEAREAFKGHAICDGGSKPSTLLHENVLGYPFLAYIH